MTTLMKLSNVIARLSLAAMVLSSTAVAQLGAKYPATQGGAGDPPGAPEIDVALVGAGVALLIGGLFVFTAVRRKRLAGS